MNLLNTVIALFELSLMILTISNSVGVIVGLDVLWMPTHADNPYPPVVWYLPYIDSVEGEYQLS